MQFSDIQGQEKAIHILQCAIQNRHIAHAYLFAGPEGVGKKQTALALAQYLNCAAPDLNTFTSCGNCPSCIQSVSGSQPDILMLEPDGASIKIEQIRTLLSKVSLRSYENAYKVIIINDAHLMTEQAANCLLKTLEEPTDNTVFILITAQVQNLPVTILSRCQQISFHLLSPSVIQDILQKLHPERQSQIGLVTALAKGSVSTAENLLANEEIAGARQEFYDLLMKLHQMRPAQIIGWCEQWDKNKKMVKALLELGQLWYHDALMVNTSGQMTLLVNQDYLAPLKSQKIAPQQLLQILQYFQTGMAQLENNASPRLIMEIVLLKTQAACTV
ncbi:MAG: DNA polymerase III subunit delta' [Peptococcaceae bacterium]|nr:DNA polymerase III subunit delta' [Peptococcaceae bacterium]